jgi:hypothetical protein
MAPVCFFLFFSAALEYSELLIELGPADLTDFTTALLHCRHQVPIYFFLGGNSLQSKEKGPPSSRCTIRLVELLFLFIYSGFISIGPVLVPQLLFSFYLSLFHQEKRCNHLKENRRK